MKPRAALLALAALLAAGLAGPLDAAAAVEIRPTQITVRADSGDKVPLDIQLRIGEEIEDLQAQPAGIPTTDGTPGIPAQHLKVQLSAIQRPASANTVSATVEIDLSGVAAGDYSGDLAFTYSIREADRRLLGDPKPAAVPPAVVTPTPGPAAPAPAGIAEPHKPAAELLTDSAKRLKGGELRLPIRITVRHRWPLPLLVMVMGISLGVGLSAYRSRGRPRDQVLVRVGLVRAFVQRDRTMSQGIVPVYQDPLPAGSSAAGTGATDGGGLPNRPIENPFRIRLEAMLIDVEMSLASERWEDARAKMDQTETLLRKWVQGRLGWIKQLAYLARLQELLAKRGGSGRYPQSLRTTVSGLIANAPAKDSPDALRDDAQTLANQIDDYERLGQKIFALGEQRLRLRDPSLEQLWTTRIEQLHEQLDSMHPDVQATRKLMEDVDRATLDLAGLLQQAAAAAAAAAATAGDGPDDAPGATRSVNFSSPGPGIEQAPDDHLGWPDEDSVDGAAGRLRLFLYASYAVALLLLTGAGFNQVYMKKANFGADLWADYFSLLIWGFGAEATRDSVTSTLRGWGLPIDNKGGDGK